MSISLSAGLTIITDGSTFFHDATKDFTYTCEPLLDPKAQAIRLNADSKDQPYKVVQDIMMSGASCLLVRTTLQGKKKSISRRNWMYMKSSPHINGYGAGNYGFVVNTQSVNGWWPRGKLLVLLERIAVFGLTSRVVGINDGWMDIIGNKRLPIWDYKCAKNGMWR
jgi:glucoamylase